jgi:predicted ribonuclease YlaK
MAAELEGFKLDYNGDEAELKTKIVRKVQDYLRASEPPLDRPYQVGLEETSNKWIQTLNSMEKDVAILSLFGMGGTGKTTLAEKIYFSFEKNDTFEKKSKLMTVRERPILDLQKELAWDLFREDVRSMEGFNKCFNCVMNCKVLIVIAL